MDKDWMFKGEGGRVGDSNHYPLATFNIFLPSGQAPILLKF